MKNRLFLLYNILSIFFFAACTSADESSADVTVQPSSRPVIPPPVEQENSGYDEKKGVGKFYNVVLSAHPDAKKAAAGKTIFEKSCSSCHRLTDDMIAGPGLKEVTKKFSAEWILNLITNATQMQQADPHLRSKAEFYQVKMPQTGLSDEQALAVYEYLRKADSKK